MIVCRIGRLLLPQKMQIQQIVKNNQRNSEILASVSGELSSIKNEILQRKKQMLHLENEELKRKIEKTMAQLVNLEIKNGKCQVPIPGSTRNICTHAENVNSSEQQVAPQLTQNKDNKGSKNETHKPKKEKITTETTSTLETIDVTRLDLRVGKIVKCEKHPDAETLYLEKIDIGESQPRTVVSGLVKYVPLEEMHDRLVVVLCNLKPAKMRGVVSEAMVMCASTPEKVEILSPPVGSVPGDLVHCDGYSRNPDVQMNPKKKIFETCAPHLKTNSDLVACYKSSPLVVIGKGPIQAQSLKNVQVK